MGLSQGQLPGIVVPLPQVARATRRQYDFFSHA
jgi:hypothetical protein